MSNSLVVLLFIAFNALAGGGFAQRTLAVSPTGRSFAVQNADGVVWLTDGLTGRKTLLSPKGQETTRLSWSSDDRYLLISRGSFVVVLDSAGKRRASFLSAAQAAISPNGQYISFVRDGHLWLAAADGTSARQIAGGSNLLAGEPDPAYAREFEVSTHVW